MLGPELARARRAAGHTQATAAAALGVDSDTVARWEREETKPHAGRLKGLADLYGVPLEGLLHLLAEDTPDGVPPKYRGSRGPRGEISERADEPVEHLEPDFHFFAAALRDAIEASGLTRRQVADRAGRGCSEATLVNWLNRRGKPDYLAVFKVEDAVGVAPGFLSRHLGFAPLNGAGTMGVREAILADEHLTDDARDALLRLYSVMVREDK